MSETIKERLKREAAEQETKNRAALTRYEGFLGGRFLQELASPWRRGVHWSPGGLRRLADIRGFLRGLIAGGGDEAEQTAFSLFADLNEKLEYLDGYGGDIEHSFPSGRPVKNVPAWLIQIGDDGTCHGFSLLWCKAIEQSAYRELLDSPDSTPAALCHEDYRTVEKNAYAPTVDGQFGPESLAFYYVAGSFVGGLLYHGPGGDEVFSVDIGAATGRPTLWSVHT